MGAIDSLVYEMIYRIIRPRWDDGSIPPQVAQLAARSGNTKNAIDLGCGTGTHSIYLAGQGFSVVGLDSSPTAIHLARARATQAGLHPEFSVHDVTRLDFLHGPFDIALDVGCLHGLNAQERRRYAQELSRLMLFGGTFLVWGGNRVAGFGLVPGEMEKLFAPGFRLERVEPGQNHGRQARWYWLNRR